MKSTIVMVLGKALTLMHPEMAWVIMRRSLKTWSW
jgi:hypothetical protein